MSSSTILYKFRSGTTFESLPLPGTAARLFDVKKGIVKAKKLDSGALEFDLSVRDATTNQEYVDESMLLPRGTRVVVQRLPAARGHGFLARMARAESGMTAPPTDPRLASRAAPSGFYTIDSSAREDEDEFVATAKGDEEKELAALMAVTDTATTPSATSGLRPAPASSRIAGSGPPQQQNRPHHAGLNAGNHRPPRPNADPELQERLMPKKRATGIPRTFLNLSAPPVTDGTVGADGEGGDVPRLQPNALGFEELVHRGGGQSEITTGTKRDLDYALKVTATSIPEHLQCGICHSVVKNAMLLPWDVEGRTACESCIRDALAQSGFRCPLTGMEGVSPDDLHPNYGLRKAAELFVKGVMEKLEEIQMQQVDEAEDEDIDESAAAATSLQGESGDKGVIVSRKTIKDHKRTHEDDPFGGGDDDFGGDVFDVAPNDADEENPEIAQDSDVAQKAETQVDEKKADTATDAVGSKVAKDGGFQEESSQANKPADITEEHSKMIKSNLSDKSPIHPPTPDAKSSESRTEPSADSKRDVRKIGPPAGYAMGPAGGASWGARGGRGEQRARGGRGEQRSPDGSTGGPYGGRGRGDYAERAPFRGRGGRSHGRHDDRSRREEGDQTARDDGNDRGSKRSRSVSEDFEDRSRYQHGGRGRGGGRGWGGGRGGGRGYDPPYGGRFDIRGPPYRGGGGGGRGTYRGRGGYGRGRGY